MNSIRPPFPSPPLHVRESGEESDHPQNTNSSRGEPTAATLLAHTLREKWRLICIRMGVVTCNEAIFSHPPPPPSPSLGNCISTTAFEFDLKSTPIEDGGRFTALMNQDEVSATAPPPPMTMRTISDISCGLPPDHSSSIVFSSPSSARSGNRPLRWTFPQVVSTPS